MTSKPRFTFRGYRPGRHLRSRSRSRSPGRRLREQENSQRITNLWRGAPVAPTTTFAQLFGSANEATAKRHQRVSLLAEGAAWEAGIRNHSEIAKAGVYAVMALQASPHISDEDAVGRGLVAVHIQPPPITAGNTEGWKARMLEAAAKASANVARDLAIKEDDEDDEDDEEVEEELSKLFKRGVNFKGGRRTRIQLRRSRRGTRKN